MPDLTDEVAKTMNGITDDDWQRIDPAVRVRLRSDAGRLIRAHVLIARALQGEEDVDD